MNLKNCNKCKYLSSLIGLELGVRCTHPQNQQYKQQIDSHLNVLISKEPNICKHKEVDDVGKLILHIPHSATFLPETFNVLNNVSLKKELNRMTDWFTDEIFDYRDGKKLIFPYSRLYCDVERFRSDKEEYMAKYGMGVCYTHTSQGTKLRDICNEEKEFIKSAIYDVHHKNLENIVNDELSQTNFALIVDCHSFSNTPLPHEENKQRPDICIGTDDFHTPKELITMIHDHFENNGFKVDINAPFGGTIIPIKYYKKDKRVKSIMIEINRRLYLNEKFEKNENFDNTTKLVHGILDKITKLYLYDIVEN